MSERRSRKSQRICTNTFSRPGVHCEAAAAAAARYTRSLRNQALSLAVACLSSLTLVAGRTQPTIRSAIPSVDSLSTEAPMQIELSRIFASSQAILLGHRDSLFKPDTSSLSNSKAGPSTAFSIHSFGFHQVNELAYTQALFALARGKCLCFRLFLRHEPKPFHVVLRAVRCVAKQESHSWHGGYNYLKAGSTTSLNSLDIRDTRSNAFNFFWIGGGPEPPLCRMEAFPNNDQLCPSGFWCRLLCANIKQRIRYRICIWCRSKFPRLPYHSQVPSLKYLEQPLAKPYKRAARVNRTDIINVLLKVSAAVNNIIHEGYGATYVGKAVRQKSTKTVKLLLDHGRLFNYHRKPPGYLFRKGGRLRVVTLFYDYRRLLQTLSQRTSTEELTWVRDGLDWLGKLRDDLDGSTTSKCLLDKLRAIGIFLNVIYSIDNGNFLGALRPYHNGIDRPSSQPHTTLLTSRLCTSSIAVRIESNRLSGEYSFIRRVIFYQESNRYQEGNRSATCFYSTAAYKCTPEAPCAAPTTSGHVETLLSNV
ncbi:uncharacterized protein BDR25DRAFT_358335 [Lindgomyces ingoldianus]|uniref:Uncharacterized protein n=1 Tax=Lindgomyces ingoldianus TaxID=673940 RepID=A0ACB6QL04_9PLEO|nr:uncharacterized protein BDR25DRAFT_358335 [Lindgomyces ingoldianus]KAF2467649.1 hypothetical protein BDR25DRAFT_358335 [Lindgomyces ingoldianus]